MLSVAEAQALVLAEARAKTPHDLPVSEALGLVLAEDIAADLDSPPYDKALVDGYAVRTADLSTSGATLEIIEAVMAGAVPRLAITAGQATRIMTGAPLPEGADAVVMHEHTTHTEAEGDGLGQVSIANPVPLGRNVLRRATSMQAGQRVLSTGHLLRPAEIGLLAEVGRPRVSAVPGPTVAVLSTGSELVPPDRVPGPGQIRNTNGPLLHAAVLTAGAEHHALGIARDDRDELKWLARAGLGADVLLLSGGVSAGDLDLVPEVLAGLGVRKIFHKVAIKPGKPLWFGVYGTSDPRCLVFGLPGNPVSSLVCFHLFVRPVLERLSGRLPMGAPAVPCIEATLKTPFSQRGDRPTYHPARVSETPSGRAVEPVTWHGSADLRALVAANALVHFPGGDREFAVGERLEVVLL